MREKRRIDAESQRESSGANQAVRDAEKKTTVALLGGNSVVDHALSLLLESAGYCIRIFEAPPTGVPEELLEGVDLLLISPDLANGRRHESLAVLRGTGERINLRVLELSSARKAELLDDEVDTVPWPISIDGLVLEIEAALRIAVPGAHGALGGEEPPADWRAATL